MKTHFLSVRAYYRFTIMLLLIFTIQLFAIHCAPAQMCYKMAASQTPAECQTWYFNGATNPTYRCYMMSASQNWFCMNTTNYTACTGTNSANFNITHWTGSCVTIQLPDGSFVRGCDTLTADGGTTVANSITSTVQCPPYPPPPPPPGGGGTNPPPGYGIRPTQKDQRFLQASLVQVPRRRVALDSEE